MHFHKWLGRPSTIRLFRVLLDQRQSTACSALHERLVRGYSTAASNDVSNGLSPGPDAALLLRGPDDEAINLGLFAGNPSRASLQHKADPRISYVDTEGIYQPLEIPADLELETRKLAQELEEAEKHVESRVVIREVLKTFFARGIAISQIGPSAEKVWGAILRSINEQSREATFIRTRLFAYALKLRRVHGSVHDRLHYGFVGQLMKIAPYSRHLRYYDMRFKAHQMSSVSDLIALVPQVVDSVLPTVAFEQWRRLYADRRTALHISTACMEFVNPEDKLYNEFVSFFERVGDTSYRQVQSAPSRSNEEQGTTISRHTVSSLDIPAHGMALPVDIAPSPTAIVSMNEPVLAMEKSATQQGNRYTRKEPVTGLEYTRAAMSAVLGDVHGISDKSPRGDFAVRLLATSFIPLQMGISLLHVLGIDKLGPIVIQEIARRAEQPQQIKLMLEHAKSQNLDLIDSTYLRLIHRLIDQQHTDELHTLLNSDQHPDNYDDVALQTELLNSLEQARDWPQVLLTVQVLAVHGQLPSEFLWNASLRTYLATKDITGIRHVLEFMKLNGILISKETCKRVKLSLLSYREYGKPEMQEKGISECRRLVADIYKQYCEQGSSIPCAAWIELLKRFGKARQIEDLTRLIQWLAGIYEEAAKRKVRVPLPPIESLFSRPLQMAIVRWPWLATGLENKLRPLDEQSTTTYEKWAAGITILRQMYVSGLPIDKQHVQDGIELQLWQLFGPETSTLPRNVKIAEDNQFSLRHYLEHIDIVWPHLMDVTLTDSDSMIAEKLFHHRTGSWHTYQREYRRAYFAKWKQRQADKWHNRWKLRQDFKQSDYGRPIQDVEPQAAIQQLEAQIKRPSQQPNEYAWDF